MNDASIRDEILRIARDFNATGLSAGASGNISVRTENGMLITPSQFPYQDLLPGDLMVLDLDGNVVSGTGRPSSEWRFHRDIYLLRTDARAVVHVHSPYATALACARLDIPAFHYLVAAAGGDSIRCAAYATFGTEALSQSVISALADRRACLLANHGVIAVGEDLASAYRMAQATEELAKLYSLCLQVGKPVLLDAQEMGRILEKFKSFDGK